MRERLEAFAGAMMIPIIILVIAGLGIGLLGSFANLQTVELLKLGWLIQENNILHIFFNAILKAGFALMNNLPPLFAIGIAMGLAKNEKSWAALSALVFYVCMITSIGTYLQVVGLSADNTTINSFLNIGMDRADAVIINSLYGTSMGIFTYKMGIFGGIIAGVGTAIIHNKFYHIEITNVCFSFFSGVRFVPVMVFIYSVFVGLLLGVVYKPIGIGLAKAGSFFTASGYLGTFIYSTLDRILLPFGLHHLIATAKNYSIIGGSLEVAGIVYEGAYNIRVAQLADPNSTGFLVRNFSSGQIISHFGAFPGAALAMLHTAKPENKKKVATIMIPALLTAMIVGITEPFQFTFLFVAPMLYFLVHAPLTGLATLLVEYFNVSIYGEALQFMIVNLLHPQKVYAIPLLFLIPLFFGIYYFVFYFLITKFNLNTPGREDTVKLYSKKDYKEKQTEEVNAQQIIIALGGENNIDTVSNCFSRLRVKVKDINKIKSNDIWINELFANGIVKKSNSVQIIYGNRVTRIALQVKELLNIN